MRIRATHILFLLPLLSSQSYGQTLISENQAKDAVRAFEGSPNMQLKVAELTHNTDGPLWSHWSLYEIMNSDTPPLDQSWTVDAISGEVVYAFHSSAVQSQSDDSPGPLTEAQCLTIAESFARQKFYDFDTTNMQLRESKWDGFGWSFEWKQKLSNDAWGVSRVSVIVSPIDGAIQTYGSRRVAISVIRTPQITPQQAIGIAEQDTGIVDQDYVSDPQLSANPDNIYWSFEIRGYDDQDVCCSYQVVINAETGAVAGKYSAADSGIRKRKKDSSPKTKTTPPLKPTPSGSRYTSILQFNKLLPGSSVRWKGKRTAILSYQRKEIRLISDHAISMAGANGRKYQITPRMMNGCLMVPSELLSHLKNTSKPANTVKAVKTKNVAKRIKK